MENGGADGGGGDGNPHYGGSASRRGCFKYDPKKHPDLPQRIPRTIGVNTRGRYKHDFHWNERISQMRLDDPEVPSFIFERIQAEAHSGRYGSNGRFSRSDVIVILHELDRMNPNGIERPPEEPFKRKHSRTPSARVKFITFRERWKQILFKLNGYSHTFSLDEEILYRVQKVQAQIVNQFWKFKSEMPLSVLRKKGRKEVIHKERHNFLPFNYVFRKIMEGLQWYDSGKENFGIFIFHWELPMIRSAIKLQNLDNIMEKICDSIGLKFVPSVILKRPKIKK
jgi:hypothetical protein